MIELFCNLSCLVPLGRLVGKFDILLEAHWTTFLQHSQETGQSKLAEIIFHNMLKISMLAANFILYILSSDKSLIHLKNSTKFNSIFLKKFNLELFGWLYSFPSYYFFFWTLNWNAHYRRLTFSTFFGFFRPTVWYIEQEGGFCNWSFHLFQHRCCFLMTSIASAFCDWNIRRKYMI